MCCSSVHLSLFNLAFKKKISPNTCGHQEQKQKYIIKHTEVNSCTDALNVHLYPVETIKVNLISTLES